MLILALNVIPLGDAANQTLHNTLFEDFSFLRLDYLVHFFAFLFFMVPILLGAMLDKPVFKEKAPLKYALLIIPSAIVFEALQFFVPFRKFNPIDMIYNLAGALLGCLIVFIFLKFSRSAQK
ncbi:MAG: VanZ family protein [Candidatus Cloacimonetes bacterium]|nr:VanZ family protein [Candidatus Cloacimonadota bacterium]